jgi:hypothetical protein
MWQDVTLALGSAESAKARWREESREEFTLFFAFPSRHRVFAFSS